MLNPDKFIGLYNTFNVTDIKTMSTKVYYLVLLAIYKKFGARFVDKFDEFFEGASKASNWILFDESNLDPNFIHIDNSSVYLDDILKQESEFAVPRDNNNQGLDVLLASRVSELQSYTVFGHERFKPSVNTNTPTVYTNIIIPHIYFTAYPIDGTQLTIHKNNSIHRQKFDNLNIDQRLPFGTFNLVVDLFSKYKIRVPAYMNNSNIENWLLKI